jgi:hypothetical protein
MPIEQSTRARREYWEGQGPVRQWSRCTEHGAFDDDGATVKATLARMLAAGAAQPLTLSAPDLRFHHGSSSLRSRRQQIDRQSPVRA